MIPPLFAVSLVVLFEALCFTTSLPVLNYYTEQLHGTGLWVGLMFALTAGPKVLTNPLWGGLSDRWGRRPVLALNTVGTFSGSVLWALAANGMPGLRPLAVLAISRGMVGAFGGQAGLAMAVAADTSTPERRAAAMGALGAAFSVALAIGPLLGGFVADRYSYAAVGWVCAVFQFTSLLVITFGLRETCVKRSTVGVAEAYRIPQTIWTQRVILVLAVVLITTTGLSEMNSTLGLMLEHDHGFTVRRTSYVFAFFGVLGALVQGGAIRPLVRRYGERAIVMVGLVITALGFGVMAAKLPSVGMWTAVGVLAIGASLVSPALSGLLSRSVSADLQGSLQGINQGVLGLGRALGGGLGGGLFESAGASLTYAVAAALSLAPMALLRIVRGPAETPSAAAEPTSL